MATQFKSETEWARPPERLALQPGDVHLWRVGLDSEAPPPSSRLSAQEWLRAGLIHAEEERRRFLTFRAALRSLFTHYLSFLPTALPLGDRGEIGGIHFIAVSSGNFGLIALSPDGAVGVDLEHVRSDIPLDELADYFYEPREVWDVRIGHGEEKAVRFFELWTRKEALVKAGRTRRAPGQLILRRIDPAPGYAAALATAGECRLACWDSRS